MATITITSGAPLLTDVTGYGAMGDGVTDDTAAIHAAYAVAGSIYFPAGTYMVTGLTFSTPGDVLLHPSATIKLIAGAAAHTVNLTAAVTITGGTIDGNRANQVTTRHGVRITAGGSGAVLDGVTITACYTNGLLGQNVSNVTVRNCTFSDTGSTSIFFQATTTAMENIQVINNTVDRSAEAVPSHCGISYHSAAGYRLTDSLIAGNHVTLPVNPSPAGAICIEVYNFCDRVAVSDNNTYGGAMGISFAAATSCTAKGNTIYGPKNCGVELAGSSHNSICGNTIDGTGGTSTNAVIASGTSPTPPNYNTVCCNTITGCADSSIQFNGGQHNAINGNVIKMTAADYAINLNAVSYFVVNNNILSGENVGLKGIMLNESTVIAMVGNEFSGFTQNNIMVYADSAVTMDDIVAMGNGALIGQALSGGGAIGNNVRSIGGGDTPYDYVDLKNLVLRRWGTGSPEGVISAGVGSTFYRRDGSASTVFYVKESGTGNTGWVAK